MLLEQSHSRPSLEAEIPTDSKASIFSYAYPFSSLEQADVLLVYPHEDLAKHKVAQESGEWQSCFSDNKFPGLE